MSLIYEHSFRVFFILTVIGGGGAAFMGGRSLALGWKPIWKLVIYMMILGAGLRFLHFALFHDTLTSLQYYIVQTLVIIGFALLGYRMTRTNQMTQQYPWLYERTGPLSWKHKA
jgi:Flp pilus assembly protein protease CpaA